MAQPIRCPAIVEEVIHHTPDVASYRLRAEKRLPRFIPGQFIHLTLEPFDPASFWPESRVFSVANAVADRRTIELTISRQGTYTSRILDELQEGVQVWAKGPYGEFTVEASREYRHIVFIAGGTGVTPFAAYMDATLTEGGLSVETATLHYGAQSPDLLLYRERAERCAETVPGFRTRLYAENDLDAEDTGVCGGRLDLATIMADTEEPESSAFYLSGPQAMIQAFQNQLVNYYGLDPRQVFVDAWE